MAEGAGAQAAPTFKLVLVGDGGTGKVCAHRHKLSQEQRRLHPMNQRGWEMLLQQRWKLTL